MQHAVPTLQTERLILNAQTPDDAPILFGVLQDAEIMQYLPIPPHTELAHTLALLETYAARLAAGTEMRWAVRLRGAPALIGQIKLTDPHGEYLSSEIGYMLTRAAWGKGYASEAVHAVLGYAFNTLQRNRIEALVYADNTPSCRLLERLGFVREGYFREHEWRLGRFWDDCVYAMLRRDFNTQPPANASQDT